MPSSNKLYLYAQSAEPPLAESAHPPPFLENLTCVGLTAAANLATLAFTLRHNPRFCWDASHGWLELPSTLVSGLFANAQDFFDAIPGIQNWLDTWSTSATRSPDLSPDWATTRSAMPAAVKAFSDGIVERLACKKTIKPSFCDDHGKQFSLRVPARAALVLSPVVVDDPTELHIAGKEHALQFVLSTGRKVILPITARSDVDLSTQSLLVNPRMLRPKQITHVKSVRTRPVDRDVEAQYER